MQSVELKEKYIIISSSIIAQNEYKNEFINEIWFTEKYQKMTNSASVKFTFNNLHEKNTIIFCLKFEDEVDINTYIFL